MSLNTCSINSNQTHWCMIFSDNTVKKTKKTDHFTPTSLHERHFIVRESPAIGEADVQLSNDNKDLNLAFKATLSHYVWFYDKDSILENGVPLLKPNDANFEPYDDKYYENKIVTAHEIAQFVGLYSILGLGLWFSWTGIRNRAFMQKLLAKKTP